MIPEKVLVSHSSVYYVTYARTSHKAQGFEAFLLAPGEPEVGRMVPQRRANQSAAVKVRGQEAKSPRTTDVWDIAQKFLSWFGNRVEQILFYTCMLVHVYAHQISRK